MKAYLGATGVLVALGALAFAVGRPDWSLILTILAIAIAGTACIKEVQRG